MSVFLASFIIVFLAEMGDKTQLLAFGLAAKYKAVPVIAGIFLATLALNALAVGAGAAISAVIPINVLSLSASFAFIGFGLWALKDEKEGNKKGTPSRLGPLFVVFAAFLIAELGDKTQLAVLSLAVKYQEFGAVLAGSVSGMFLGDSLGFTAGLLLHRRLPREKLKFVSAAAFVLFGLLGLFSYLRNIRGTGFSIAASAAVLVLTIILAVIIIKKESARRQST
ncbi:MAG: TMEM165/GDT1 family protein [Endomicrobiales bacterium]|nr:TMEM165/GDT1 family protein [Endomicrobiales bacterium]